MIGVLGSFCCCGGEGCSKSCGLTSYLVAGLGGNYRMYKEQNTSDKCVCRCAEDGADIKTDFDLTVSFQQIGTAVLSRHLVSTNPSGCCYRATGVMRVWGTLSYGEVAVCCQISDPPRCVNSQTYSFDTEVDFCYTVLCTSLTQAPGCSWDGSGAQWHHLLDICDFGLAETADFLDAQVLQGLPDEGLPGAYLCGPTPGCPTYAAGIACGGAHLTWRTPMQDFLDLDSSVFGQQPITLTEQRSCAGLQWPGQGGTGDPDIEGCMNYVEWNDFYNGPFALYQVREFSDPEGPDPWIPCSLGYAPFSWIGAQGGGTNNLTLVFESCFVSHPFDLSKPCWFNEENGESLPLAGSFTCDYQQGIAGAINVPVYT